MMLNIILCVIKLMFQTWTNYIHYVTLTTRQHSPITALQFPTAVPQGTCYCAFKGQNIQI